MRWFTFNAEDDIGLDHRLVAPALERMACSTAVRDDVPATGQRRSDVSVIGYLRTASGVGEMARRTVDTLASSGMKVEGIDINLNVVATRNETSSERYLVERATGRVQIFHVNADQLLQVLAHIHDRLDHDAVRICVPFWELGRFPQPWLETFSSIDEIWAPSWFIQRMLMRDVGKPVVHMPPAVDVRPPPSTPATILDCPMIRSSFSSPSTSSRLPIAKILPAQWPRFGFSDATVGAAERCWW